MENGTERIYVQCATDGVNLGVRFEDGPQDINNGKVYVVNSTCLNFIPLE